MTQHAGRAAMKPAIRSGLVATRDAKIHRWEKVYLLSSLLLRF
jgi:hypothetical protein